MIHTRNKGFTLIELIVAISILFLFSMMVFAPYSFYLNKSKVKHTSKEISQVIYEAKNKAKNGSASSTGNLSIGIYFDATGENKYSYKLLSFPHNIIDSVISLQEGTLIEESILQPGIQLESIGGEDKGIIFFRSITGSGLVLTGDSLSLDSSNEITLEYSYKGASYGLLYGSLTYFQDTQIVDY